MPRAMTNMALLVTALSLQVAAQTSGKPVKTVVKLGYYDGNGTSQSADPGFLRVLTQAATQSLGAGYYTIAKLSTGAEVIAAAGKASSEAFDVLVFPGGSGNGQAAALGEAGLVAVRNFVAQGGGYIGTCGGAFLGLQHLLFYGEGPLGSEGHRGPPTQEPFDRGHGDVQVQFTAAGVSNLKLRSTSPKRNVTIMYWQGPIVKDAQLPSNVTRLAFFRSEIHTNHPNETTGEMVNTPAITSIDCECAPIPCRQTGLSMATAVATQCFDNKCRHRVFVRWQRTGCAELSSSGDTD